MCLHINWSVKWYWNVTSDMRGIVWRNARSILYDARDSNCIYYGILLPMGKPKGKCITQTAKGSLTRKKTQREEVNWKRTPGNCLGGGREKLKQEAAVS